jgi:hypothetical protein
MKHFIVLFFTLFVAHLLSAQMDTSKRHEISLNTQIVQNFIGNESFQQPYTLMYKWKLQQKNVLRLGVGGTFSREKAQEDGFADSETQLNYSIDARLGYERRILFPNAKTLAYFGGDVAFHYQGDELIIDSGFDKVSTLERTSGFGIGPVLGVQHHITPRLSISTEGAFYFFYKNKTEAQLFQNFPNFDDIINQVEIFEIQQIIPASIYLNFVF